MKRKKVVYVNFTGGTKIKISIETKTNDLVRHEATSLINTLASDAMRSITNAPYHSAFLSEIQVK